MENSNAKESRSNLTSAAANKQGFRKLAAQNGAGGQQTGDSR